MPDRMADHRRRTLNDEERLDWLRLIRSTNVGPGTFFRLLERFGTAAKALDAIPDLARRGGGSEVARDVLQLGAVGRRAVLVEAVVDVVVNESPLCALDGFLDCAELLRDVHAGPAGVDHLDDGPQVAVRALQARDDRRVTCVDMGRRHRPTVSTRGGCSKSPDRRCDAG